jgi:predicted dithiol-disulfide oxidoreductase (DUF899 family)
MGEIFRTYSSYARGGEEILGIYGILDAMPKGRNETVTLSLAGRLGTAAHHVLQRRYG